jgi:simple sugar transport system permease protein
VPDQEDPPAEPSKPEANEDPTEPRASHEVVETEPLVQSIFAPPAGSWRDVVLVPALAILTALAIGALVVIFSDAPALSAWSRFFADPLAALNASAIAVRDAYYALFSGALGSPSQIAQAIGSGDLHRITLSFGPLSETVVNAVPLILAGLSVAIGFRAGLFNIGAEGQITVGGIAAVAAGFSFPGLPGPIHLALIVVAGMAGGMIWGAVPGFLKAKTGAHEVITTIMLNFVAFRLLDYALSTRFFLPPGRNDPVSKPALAAFPHLFGSSLRVNAGIFVALAVAVMIAWLYNRTTWGFEFRAVGANPYAARAAGMSPTRTFILVMALAGGAAGLAGGILTGSTNPRLAAGFSSGYGFDAIALALLGRSKPSGVVAAAFLLSALRVGARSMQASTGIPLDLVTVIQALVILFIAAPALVRAIYRIKAQRLVGAEVFTKGWGG